jgi:hypothetical protein
MWSRPSCATCSGSGFRWALRCSTPEEAAEPALYAHKVTVDRAYGGQGLGAELLDWAGNRAADEGPDWLRVDVWTTNERLQHYYLRRLTAYRGVMVSGRSVSSGLLWDCRQGPGACQSMVWRPPIRWKRAPGNARA